MSRVGSSLRKIAKYFRSDRGVMSDASVVAEERRRAGRKDERHFVSELSTRDTGAWSNEHEPSIVLGVGLLQTSTDTIVQWTPVALYDVIVNDDSAVS